MVKGTRITVTKGSRALGIRKGDRAIVAFCEERPVTRIGEIRLAFGHILACGETELTFYAPSGSDFRKLHSDLGNIEIRVALGRET